MNKLKTVERVHTHTHTHTSRILKEEKRVDEIYSKSVILKIKNRLLLNKKLFSKGLFCC